ncbi:hypothetical protein NKH77_11595 [Streptomyces sp. M19]
MQPAPRAHRRRAGDGGDRRSRGGDGRVAAARRGRHGPLPDLPRAGSRVRRVRRLDHRLPRRHPVVDLPTYAFQHERFWLEAPEGEETGVLPVDTVEAEFWSAVEREDLVALAGTLHVDGGQPLREVLPALSSWRRQRREESAVDAWRYGIDWQPVDLGNSASLTGSWLLVVPEGAADDAVAADVEGALVGAGADVTRFPVNATEADRETLRERLTGLRADGVVSLLGLDERPHARHGVVAAGLAGTMALVQALADAGLDGPLWTVTRGAVSVGGSEPLRSAVQAQVWGLGRVAALEYPRLWGGLVDLPERFDRRTAARLCGHCPAGPARTRWPSVRPVPGAVAWSAPGPRGRARAPVEPARHRPGDRRHRRRRRPPRALARGGRRRAHRARRAARARRPGRGRRRG